MPEPTPAIQLIVFGQRNRDDIGGVLKDVADAGYPAIEAGNMFASYGEDNARRLLAENGLKPCGAHFGYGDYADPAKLAANIAYCKAMGVKNMMCSGVADTKTVEGYRTSCAVFNQVGARCRDEGITFNYHNHNWEFTDLGGGVNGMQIIGAETDPALVKFNIDVFWVTIGGADPVQFIRQHADRAGYYHFKDGRKKPDGVEFLELGRGEVNLKGSMAVARELGATWIVYEQDQTRLPHKEAIGISREYMRRELDI